MVRIDLFVIHWDIDLEVDDSMSWSLLHLYWYNEDDDGYDDDDDDDEEEEEYNDDDDDRKVYTGDD